MVRPLPPPQDGYSMPGGGLEPDLATYLVAVLREQYARDEIDVATLEQRAAAALQGDYVGAGLPFPPMRTTLLVR